MKFKLKKFWILFGHHGLFWELRRRFGLRGAIRQATSYRKPR